MKTTRKLLSYSLIALSILSFLYLNIIGVGDTSEFSISSINAYNEAESNSFQELRAVGAIFERIVEIVTLK